MATQQTVQVSSTIDPSGVKTLVRDESEAVVEEMVVQDTSVPDMKAIEEDAVRAPPTYTRVDDPMMYQARFRKGWRSSATFDVTEKLGNLLCHMRAEQVSSLWNKIAQEDEWLRLVTTVVDNYRGIPRDVDRATSPISHMKHTEWSQAGVDLEAILKMLHPTEQGVLLKTLYTISDMDDANDRAGWRHSVAVLHPMEKTLYESLSSLEMKLETNVTQLKKYVMSQRSIHESMLEKDESYRPQYARCVAPPNPNILNELIRQNPRLVMHWQDYVLSLLSSETSFVPVSVTMTVQKLLDTFRFETTRADSLRAALQDLDYEMGMQLLRLTIARKLWGPYFRIEYDVKMDSFSMATLITLTGLRMFPKHLLTEHSRTACNNWVAYHLLVGLMRPNDRHSFVANFDRYDAESGLVDYLPTALAAIQNMHPEVHAFWSPDNYPDGGVVRPVMITTDDAPYQAGTGNVKYVPYAGFTVLHAADHPMFKKLLDYAMAMTNTKLKLVQPQMPAQYVSFLTYLSTKTDALAEMAYTIDQIALNVGTGMPIVPLTSTNHNDYYHGARTHKIKSLTPLSMLTLVDFSRGKGPGITKRFEMTSLGMTLNGAVEILVDLYSFAWPKYNLELRSKRDAVKAMLSNFPGTIPKPISFVFDEWMSPDSDLAATIVVPDAKMSRSIYFDMLEEADAFLHNVHEWYGITDRVYIVPPFASEHEGDGSVYYRTFEADGSDVSMLYNRDTLEEAIAGGKFHQLIRATSRNGQSVAIESWIKFTIEKSVEVPYQDARSTVEVAYAAGRGVSLSDVVWYYHIMDDEAPIMGDKAPIVRPPSYVMRRPSNAFFPLSVEQLISWISWVRTQRDSFVTIDFTNFVAVSRE